MFSCTELIPQSFIGRGGFHTDHRGIFADVDGEQLLGLQMKEPEQQDGRRLRSKNNKHRLQYIEQLCKHLKAHDVYRRVGKLSSSSQDGDFSATDVEEYNTIDNCIMNGMIAAKKASRANC